MIGALFIQFIYLL